MSRKRDGEAPPLPEPLPAPIVDNHTHLDIVLESVDSSTGAELDKAQSVGVDRIVQVGTTLQSSVWAAQLAASDDRVLAAIAVHPNDAPRLDARELDAALAELDQLAGQQRVRAVGETGLDFYRTRDDEALKVQEQSFRRHIDLAKRHGLALMIHDRDAHDDVFAVLESEGAPDTVVFHCFSGDAAMARRCADLGYYMSFAGNTTFAKSTDLREAAVVAPRELLMLETDAPFLTPTPYRGRPNSPYLTALTARAIADERGDDLGELCVAVSENAERVYGSWA
ncbi:YchF/TatD family DNA exonuclease [Epidermidibacterium keratini]|uniref:YchF/TatD family DNA exonuclease n=1 Tax=Epidermidibacterium keratini TaxID=1891644 RepID=A0A7L4YQ12_9ACTN|nr:TatD family hydrolase [Epidermidibacterium keratini]QHC01256.1 YchF/TatD family DNA exonuclease [Epidermidibacterium keratini]